MTHAMDLVFIEGVDGTRKAINFLRGVRDMLQNNGANSTTVTVKYDGAPAIICGIDPVDGKFFVAKKGIFNKSPKVYKTQADIDADLSGELHAKFSILLPELKKLGIKGIVQGDLMFTHDDLKTTTIDGVKYITFQPNTIVYSVPADSALAKTILKAKVGIAFHTTYSGDDFASLEASFGKPIVDKLKKVSSVWALDAMYEDATGKANFTPAESKQVTDMLTSIGKQFRSVSADIINHIHNDQEALDLVLIYINSRIRQNLKRESGYKIAAGFLQFVHDRYAKEIADKKSVKGKQTSTDKRDRVIKYLLSVDVTALGKIFDLAYDIDEVKNVIITVLNRAGRLSHFLRTSNGYKVTNPEGFVAINSDGDAIKLVDRLTFSQANFGGSGADKILRGWENDFFQRVLQTCR